MNYTIKYFRLLKSTQSSQSPSSKPRQAHRPETWIERLLAAEQTDRKIKSLRHQLKAARFPINRDLLGFDWTKNTAVTSSS